ncbi:hypothetical protein [Pediococcus argentinicus]|nr:hypothetical protein [Pediococcus argentinicus]
MKQWLLEHGVVKKLVVLDVFDYLENNTLAVSNFNKKIVFAGNLEKSSLLSKVDNEMSLSVIGPNPRLHDYSSSISYIGEYTPNDLPSHMKDFSFGLVWDGDSVTTCNGVYGEYLRYNNSHKLSLYLSTGIPVVVWKESATAEFVNENKVGITVGSLTEAQSLIDNMTESEYSILKNNAIKLSEKLKTGFFTTNAIREALK